MKEKCIYDTISKLNSLVSTTYVYAVIVALVAIGIAIIIAKLIPFQGGSSDRSYIARRVWFIITGLIAFIAFFLYNQLVVQNEICRAPLKSKFSDCNVISVIVIILIYLIISFIIMKAFRRSKFGSILGNK